VLPADRLHNFAQTVEMRENPSGGVMIPSASYRITRDGFTWLAMRFRGKKALVFQVAYTDAFNAMASRMVAHSLWWLFSFVMQNSGKIACLRSQMSRAPQSLYNIVRTAYLRDFGRLNLKRS
jgi:hypothetical protein